MNKVVIGIISGLCLICVVVFLVVGRGGNKPTDSNNVIDNSNSSDVADFYDSDSYKKIVDNKSDIVKVTLVTNSEGEETREDCDVEDAYKKIKGIKIIEKTPIAVADLDSYYLFEFGDGSSVKIHFEGPYLRYNNENYEIEYEK